MGIVLFNLYDFLTFNPAKTTTKIYNAAISLTKR
jgi:hypothetical protein